MVTEPAATRNSMAICVETVCSEIPSDATAVFGVILAVVRLQEGLLTQDLTVEQPNSDAEINQKDPVGEYQELPQQDRSKGYIDGIAAQGKDSGRDQLVGTVRVDANPKTLPK